MCQGCSLDRGVVTCGSGSRNGTGRRVSESYVSRERTILLTLERVLGVVGLLVVDLDTIVLIIQQRLMDINKTPRTF